MKRSLKITLLVLAIVIVLLIIFFVKDYFFYNHELASKIDKCNTRTDLKPGEDCYIEFYSEIKDSSICKKVDNYVECFDKVALYLNDSSICNNLPLDIGGGSNYREGCYSSYAIKNNDIKTCESIKDPRIQDECFEIVSIHLNNISICERVKDFQFKNDCLSKIGNATGDIKICDEIEDNHLLGLTFSKCIPYSVNDSQICLNLNNSIHTDWCLTYVGINNKNHHICDKIKETKIKDYCYTSISVKLNNTAICDLISDSEVANYCYKGVVNYKI